MAKSEGMISWFEFLTGMMLYAAEHTMLCKQQRSTNAKAQQHHKVCITWQDFKARIRQDANYLTDNNFVGSHTVDTINIHLLTAKWHKAWAQRAFAGPADEITAVHLTCYSG